MQMNNKLLLFSPQRVRVDSISDAFEIVHLYSILVYVLMPGI